MVWTGSWTPSQDYMTPPSPLDKGELTYVGKVDPPPPKKTYLLPITYLPHFYQYFLPFSNIFFCSLIFHPLLGRGTLCDFNQKMFNFLTPWPLLKNPGFAIAFSLFSEGKTSFLSWLWISSLLLTARQRLEDSESSSIPSGAARGGIRSFQRQFKWQRGATVYNCHLKDILAL